LVPRNHWGRISTHVWKERHFETKALEGKVGTNFPHPKNWLKMVTNHEVLFAIKLQIEKNIGRKN